MINTTSRVPHDLPGRAKLIYWEDVCAPLTCPSNQTVIGVGLLALFEVHSRPRIESQSINEACFD